jgi:hypothetical protein
MANRKRQPIQEQRQRVKALAGYGLSRKEIATLVGTSVETLSKRFNKELTLGPLEAQSNVLSTLFRKAMARNPIAVMFYLKTRARWSERGPREEVQPPSHTVWNIQEYAPPRSPEQQKLVDELAQRFDPSPPPPVRWEGDQGYNEDEEDEAPRRRRLS